MSGIGGVETGMNTHSVFCWATGKEKKLKGKIKGNFVRHIIMQYKIICGSSDNNIAAQERNALSMNYSANDQ